MELPDQARLPLERVRPETLRRPTGERWNPGPSFSGQIVEDWLDDRPVYPEPPRHGRALRRLPRLFARLSTPIWLVALLAGVLAPARLVDLWPTGAPSSSAAGAVLEAILVFAAVLLPAGVLIWRPDAWRSARLVLVGAIAWTTLPAIAGLVWALVRRSPDLMDRIGYGFAIAVSAAIVVGYLGPVLVCLGLDRTRRRKAEWLSWMGPRAVSLALLTAVFTAERWLPLSRDTLRLPEAVGGAALPIEVVCLGLLASASLSAVIAEEPQRRLWQLVAAGAATLAGVATYQLFSGELLVSPAANVAANSSPTATAVTATMLAGSVVLLLGFASPVWSAARDAVGREPTAPEHVFAWGAAAQRTYGDPVPMSRIVAIAAGRDHALALDEHGRVGAWGDDSVGQTDVPAGLSEVMAIAAGDGFSLALRADGSVVAWGDNSAGQTDVPAGLCGVSSIAAGYRTGYALRVDGTLACWGDGACTDVPSGLEGLTAIAAGERHALALRNDGTVVAWGDNSYGQCEVPPRLRGVTSVSAGRDFCLALRKDGTVVAWGDNSYGQLDVPELKEVAAVSAGAFHALALGADGDVIGWGGGGYRPGDADHPWHLLQFDTVAAGDGFSIGLKATRPGPVHRHDR